MDNKLKIINYLGKHINEEHTMHKLSKLLKIPYATFYRTIKEMKDIVIKKQIGKAYIITLNKNQIKSYLIVSSIEEKKEYLEKHPIINKISKEIQTKDMLLLFGSYAKKTQTEKSDIDLLIINKDGKKTITFSKYELLFKIKINPIFITKNEYKQMLKENQENLGKQVLKDHIILNNADEFWGETLNAI